MSSFSKTILKACPTSSLDLSGCCGNYTLDCGDFPSVLLRSYVSGISELVTLTDGLGGNGGLTVTGFSILIDLSFFLICFF